MTVTLARPRGSNLIDLFEHIATSGNVDRAAGIIRNVKVLGHISANGREYSKAAMQQAAKLYEGTRVAIDHPDTNPRRGRGLADEFGVLRNVRLRENSVFADLHYVKSHPLAAFILEKIERFPREIGLSHNAEGRIVTRDGRSVVESLVRVHSVDLVTHPATNSGIFESRRDHLPADWPRDSMAFARLVNDKCHLNFLESDDLILMTAGGQERERATAQDVRNRVSKAVDAIVTSTDLTIDQKLAHIRKLLTDLEAAIDGFDVADDSIDAAYELVNSAMESLQIAALQRDVRRLDDSYRLREKRQTVSQSLPEHRPTSVREFATLIR